MASLPPVRLEDRVERASFAALPEAWIPRQRGVPHPDKAQVAVYLRDGFGGAEPKGRGSRVALEAKPKSSFFQAASEPPPPVSALHDQSRCGNEPPSLPRAHIAKARPLTSLRHDDGVPGEDLLLEDSGRSARHSYGAPFHLPGDGSRDGGSVPQVSFTCQAGSKARRSHSNRSLKKPSRKSIHSPRILTSTLFFLRPSNSP
jgi:hypothetical protein